MNVLDSIMNTNDLANHITKKLVKCSMDMIKLRKNEVDSKIRIYKLD